MNGYGRFIYTNGDYYIGTFLNHKKHGQGKYVMAKTEAVHEGEWLNDKFMGADANNTSQDGGQTTQIALDPEAAGNRATINASLAEFARSAFNKRRSSSIH